MSDNSTHPINGKYREAWEQLCLEHETKHNARMPMTNREAELASLIDSLVAASVDTHKILGTPKDSTMSLPQRASQVMAELKELRERVKERQ